MAGDVKWHGDEIKRRLADQLEAGMGKSMQFCVRTTKIALNRSQPTKAVGKQGRRIGLDPSKPGEPPKKITAQLQNSITSAVRRTTRAIIGRFGSTLKGKARGLELGTEHVEPRPHLRPTVLEHKDEIARLIVKG